MICFINHIKHFIINPPFSGDLWQLPPIYDNLVTDNNHLDGRPDFAPSHWKENFKIFYLTEKMRSQTDPSFSDLCDRVGRGNITNDDENYLQSRVQPNDSENCNETFKEGKLLIIVTTNLKKDLINQQKLTSLLPDEKEYTCNSIDRVTNLPVGNNLPHKLKENAGKTGNLQTELKLKVGAPVVITSNHSKQKYREDGIVNGARGFVQAIQVSVDNLEKVEVVWIVFKNENIGRLYRFEYKHLRRKFNPGHENATPILPSRKNFKIKFGNVEYQRQNFALSLAYSVTAHKCQGETLEEVIIDFGPDLKHKIKNYICPGSFYVALTRVREGTKVFLQSFDKSYIQVNKKIEEKVDAMIKYNSYEFKKLYLDQKIFEVDNSEIKVGYLNINGLQDGNHDHYFNADKNLNHLDLIVLAETKLNAECKTETLENCLVNWKILGRYDAEDQRKHMGLLVLASRKSQFNGKLSITYQTSKREGNLQIEGIILRLECNLKLGFVYCRSSPNNQEISAINKYFGECNVLMGDLNLSHRVTKDIEKVRNLCQHSKISALQEITRSISQNQLDYILMDELLSEIVFVTSFNNFISDHKSITARIGLDGNQFTKEIKVRLSFDSESHLKAKQSWTNQQDDTSESSSNEGSSAEESMGKSLSSVFRRKIDNPDMSSCWLNACLQLLLTAFDHSEPNFEFYSELGKELLKINDQSPIDPTNIKDIIVFAEETRISLRKSEVMSTIKDLDEQQRQLRNIDQVYLNLGFGQQCVRDFFICLNENVSNWIDLYEFICFHTVDTTMCLQCQHKNESHQRQIYIEMEVPPEGSTLSNFVEEQFNGSYLVDYNCESCNMSSEAEKRLVLNSVENTNFVIVLLRRSVFGDEGNRIIKNKINAVDDLRLM